MNPTKLHFEVPVEFFQLLLMIVMSSSNIIFIGSFLVLCGQGMASGHSSSTVPRWDSCCWSVHICAMLQHKFHGKKPRAVLAFRSSDFTFFVNYGAAAVAGCFRN